MSNLVKALKEYSNGLWEIAKENKENADKAYKNGDLTLAAFHKGVSTVEDIASGLDDILADYEEEE